MMIHAYDSIYLDKAARIMGNMLHVAVIDQGMNGDNFLQQFIQSGIAEEFEQGNPKYVAGKSGGELFMDVHAETFQDKPIHVQVEHFERSDAYWAGWVLAHYQWYCGKSFEDILNTIPFCDLLSLYPTMHETDIRKCYEIMDMHFEHIPSKLKIIRKNIGLTQEELAKCTEVSLNTIRAYERKSKDINKAQVDILLRLSKGLCCEIKDLLD